MKAKGKKRAQPPPPTIRVDPTVRRFIVEHQNNKKPGKDIILYTLDGTTPEPSVHGFPEVGRRLGEGGFTKPIEGVGEGHNLAVTCTAVCVRNNGSSDVTTSRAAVVTAHIRACPVSWVDAFDILLCS